MRFVSVTKDADGDLGPAIASLQKIPAAERTYATSLLRSLLSNILRAPGASKFRNLKASGHAGGAWREVLFAIGFQFSEDGVHVELPAGAPLAPIVQALSALGVASPPKRKEGDPGRFAATDAQGSAGTIQTCRAAACMSPRTSPRESTATSPRASKGSSPKDSGFSSPRGSGTTSPRNAKVAATPASTQPPTLPSPRGPTTGSVTASVVDLEGPTEGVRGSPMQATMSGAPPQTARTPIANDGVASLTAATGASPDEAVRLLQLTGGQLEAATEPYFERHGNPSTVDPRESACLSRRNTLESGAGSSGQVRPANLQQQPEQQQQPEGDPLAEANQLLDEGEAEEAVDNLDEAIQIYERCRQCADRITDADQRAAILGAVFGSLGNACSNLGQHEPAADYLTQALTLFRTTGDRHSVGTVLTKLGDTCSHLLLYDRALVYFDEALDVFHRIGSASAAASCMRDLGIVYYHLNRQEESENYLEQSAADFREVGDTAMEEAVWAMLGQIRIAAADAAGTVHTYARLRSAYHCVLP